MEGQESIYSFYNSLPVTARLRALRRAARGLCRAGDQATGRRSWPSIQRRRRRQTWLAFVKVLGPTQLGQRATVTGTQRTMACVGIRLPSSFTAAWHLLGAIALARPPNKFTTARCLLGAAVWAMSSISAIAHCLDRACARAMALGLAVRRRRAEAVCYDAAAFVQRPATATIATMIAAAAVTTKVSRSIFLPHFWQVWRVKIATNFRPKTTARKSLRFI